ncbi:LysR family transcriptional regulator [Streptomyces glaucus]|uniref:LysR family transcriptional regulator n=1 Tax=Streptomyces glaucus TaxID=284029 RepID=UPI0031D7F6A4
MEIHHLRAFQEVARVLSFTQAARNLYCAQSTVTGQIKSLEKGLGVQLFHRKGRCPIELTEAGVLLQQRAALILEAVDSADRDVRRAALPRPRSLSGRKAADTLRLQA